MCDFRITAASGAAVAAAGFAGEAEGAKGGKDFGDLVGVAAGEMFGDLLGFERGGCGSEDLLHRLRGLSCEPYGVETKCQDNSFRTWYALDDELHRRYKCRVKGPRMRRDIEIACSECGSWDVRRDATAGWNVSTQTWELAAVFDQGYCEDCGGEARLVEISLQSQQGRYLQ